MGSTRPVWDCPKSPSNNNKIKKGSQIITQIVPCMIEDTAAPISHQTLSMIITHQVVTATGSGMFSGVSASLVTGSSSMVFGSIVGLVNILPY